ELLSLPMQGCIIGSVEFSPDGKRLASANHEMAQVKLFSAETGEELLTFKGPARVSKIAFSPDGRRLASGGPGSDELKLWDTQTGEELLTFENIGRGGVSFSPDGHRLATAGGDGLKIYDATPLPA